MAKRRTKKKKNRTASKKQAFSFKQSAKAKIADRRRAALKGIRRAKALARERSERVKRSWKVRRKRYGPSGRKKKRIVTPPPKRKREYFVVLTFTTRKRGRMVTRRLYEAIVTLPDGATEDEVLKAYQEKIQEQHPKLHNAEIERLLFGENRGRRIKIVPRDTPGSEAPSGSVRVNDARNQAKRKT